MGIKIFLLAFLVVYAAQGINASSEYELEASNRGVEDQLKQLLEQLKEAVRAAVEEATKVAKELYEKLSEIAKAEIDTALKALKEIVDKTKAEIEKLKEQAAELGEAARACVEAQRGDAEALAEETRAKLMEVSKNFHIAIEALIVQSLKPVKAVADEVKQLIADFMNCGNVICKIGVLSKVGLVVKKVREAIVEVKQVVADFIVYQLPATRKQLTEVIVNHQDKNAVIVGKVRECMDNIGN